MCWQMYATPRWGVFILILGFSLQPISFLIYWLFIFFLFITGFVVLLKFVRNFGIDDLNRSFNNWCDSSTSHTQDKTNHSTFVERPTYVYLPAFSLGGCVLAGRNVFTQCYWQIAYLTKCRDGAGRRPSAPDPSGSERRELGGAAKIGKERSKQTRFWRRVDSCPLVFLARRCRGSLYCPQQRVGVHFCFIV